MIAFLKSRYFLVPALVLVFLWVLLYGCKAEAQTGTEACVTDHEWSLVQPGMTRRDVREILDGDGNRGDSVGTRWYRICGKGSKHHRAFVWYRHQGQIMAGGVWMIQHGGSFRR